MSFLNDAEFSSSCKTVETEGHGGRFTVHLNNYKLSFQGEGYKFYFGITSTRLGIGSSGWSFDEDLVKEPDSLMSIYDILIQTKHWYCKLPPSRSRI